MSISKDWEFYLERVGETTAKLKALTERCEVIIKSMWLIENRLGQDLAKRGEDLSPSESFILAYFRRNIVYLQSAYILTSIGFVHPSRCLQRVVYETILRGYFFIVNPKEAENYYSHLRTEKEEEFLGKRKRYGHSFLCKKLFQPKTQINHRTLYKELCVSSHAEIKGLLVDFPIYDEKAVEDKLKMILSLSYGNIQMIAEEFLELFDSSLKKIMKIALKEIIDGIERQVPLFEPDTITFSSKIRFKSGNFMMILA